MFVFGFVFGVDFWFVFVFVFGHPMMRVFVFVHVFAEQMFCSEGRSEPEHVRVR